MSPNSTEIWRKNRGRHRLNESIASDSVRSGSPDRSAPVEHLQVQMAGLSKLNVRPGLPRYMRQIWARRYFIVTDARFRAFRTVKSYRLWRFWLVAQPLLDAAMYGLIFGLLLKTSRGIDNFLGFLVLGVTFFSLLTSLVNGGQSLLQTSKNLMQAFAFPRAALVLSQSLRYMIDSLPALIIGVVFALVAQYREPLSWKVILVVPLALLMWLMGTGLMFIVARLTAFIPEVKVLINLAIRGWFFASGVFFSIERFAESGEAHRLLAANPGYIFLRSVRECVIYDTVPSLASWLQLVAWSVGLFSIGLVFFWLAEERYVRVQ